ncbi:MAG: glycosyltransferase family 39 protein [Arenicellales bacterium]|nr:glycosyltransferase family 39 protein [Arenicellales bacterium]
MYTRIAQLAEAENSQKLFWLATVLIALNILWRSVRYALGFPLFGDEAFVANSFLVRDFLGLTEGLEHYQIVPLLYLWGTWLLSYVVGQSEWGLRLLSYVAGIAGVLLFAHVSLKFLPKKTALFSLAIFCASYYPVRHAAEVKPYSLDLLVSLCITVTAWNFLTARNKQNTFWWALACVVGVWASYPSIFVAGGICLVIFGYGLIRQRAYLLPTVAVGLATSLSFASMYYFIGSAQNAAAGDILVQLELWASTFPPWSEPSRFFDWFVHVHLGKMFAYPNGGNNGGSALTFILFCIGAWSLWRQERLKVLVLLSPFPLMFVAASLHAYPYGGSARVAQHVAPAICLLAAAGLAYLMRIRPGGHIEKRALVFVGICMALILGGIVRDVVKPYKELADQDNREVIEQMAEAATDEERWIVFGVWGDVSRDVPNLYHWAGSAARLRYYLLRLAGERIQWGPNPAEILEGAGSPKLLLAYQHPYVPFPHKKFEAYLRQVNRGLRTELVATHPFRELAEKLVVYELTPIKK